MRAPAEEWLRLAKTDLHAMERLAEQPELIESALFHCQQAVEKALKAVLEQHEHSIPRIHDLNRLHSVVLETRVDLPVDKDMLGELSDFYIAARYPVDGGYAPVDPPDLETARSFMSFAHEIVDQAGSLLGEPGHLPE